MPLVLITGSSGLVGSQSVHFFIEKGFDVIGIDNDMRSIFGERASTAKNNRSLQERYGTRYQFWNGDIRDQTLVEKIFQQYQTSIKLVIHTAAQPSHDWATRDPYTDFTINANGTLLLLEATRNHCPEAVFIFTSTNKVYGEHPNALPFEELPLRWEIDSTHPCATGIDETMSIDQTQHSLFGTSKSAADLLVQEYGRYFGMKTGVFRGGCLTGPLHSGSELHGFLAYLMKCTLEKHPYSIFGYEGKQVRDNLHSADLVQMFYHFYQNPRAGEVYNVGGSRHSHCSLKEAIQICETLSGNRLEICYHPQPRKGDHRWYITNIAKFQQHYPAWSYQYTLPSLMDDIYQTQVQALAVG